MKKSTKYLLTTGIIILVVALLSFMLFFDPAKDIKTTDFLYKAGIMTAEKGTVITHSYNEETKVTTKSINLLDENNVLRTFNLLYDETKTTKKSSKVSDDGSSIITTYEVTETGFVIVDGGDKTPIKEIVVNTYNLVGYDARKNPIYKTSFSRDTNYNTIITEFGKLPGHSTDFTDPNAGSFWSSLMMPLITIGIGILLLVLFMKQAQGGTKGAMDFGKTKAKVNQNVPVRFSDVAGAEEEKRELQEVVEFLKNPKKFSSLGARVPKGVLLVGPPGTGKTLFAKAVAGEANVPFFSISGSDFVEMFVGVGASRVRDLFSMAKKAMPCIVFIDEIDAVGRQRGAGLGGGNDEREQTLNQLLVQMDGFDANEGIIIMAATNRADILDPALMRPGRFDRQIYINLPDVRGREAILKVHSRNKPLAANVNFKILARMTAGFSGADLANLLNEAAILAARANRKAITNEDLYEAIEKVMMGPKKSSKLVTESDKRITAYHESGHAICAKLLPHCDEVHEVTIIPRGNAGGYTMTRPDNDDQYMSKNELLDRLVMSLGGRAAEEIIIKDFTSGASADIKQASKIARAMVTELGMSDKIGPVNYSSDDQIFVGRDYQTRTAYSESLATVIDEEVEKLIKNAHEKAIQLLTENKDKLELMARLLIERETIYSEEVAMIMRGESLETITEYMDKNAEAERKDPFRVGLNNKSVTAEQFVNNSSDNNQADNNQANNNQNAGNVQSADNNQANATVNKNTDNNQGNNGDVKKVDEVKQTKETEKIDKGNTSDNNQNDDADKKL